MAHPFVNDSARKRAKEAVVKLESRASSELVIAVRGSSASYLHVSLLVGFLFAEVALCLALFLPEPFTIDFIPVDVAVAFGLGVLIAWRLPWLARLCTSVKTRQRHTVRAARSAFFDQHIARTHTHRGIFVYVSLLERCVAVVEDGGIDPATLGSAWTATIARLEDAVRSSDFDGFLAGIDAMGELLAKTYPHRDDDVNELPDEEDVA